MTEKHDQPLPILVVDDSLFLRSRIRLALQADGYVLIEANNGLTALQAIEQQEFACVLTDLVMPELDGFGLLEELRKRNYSRPIVVLTADIQKSTRDRCHEMGAAAFVQKPINAAELRSIVASMIAK